MQLCALDKDETLIFAAKAQKQKDYQCLECRETVRLRSGLHRRPHFYHAQPNGQCRLHAKGMPHLMLQYRLIDLLPEKEAEMECRFPSIGRIADIAWHAKKIIYEIQYSPISAEEVIARNNAYASLGYQVVWILHDRRFNQPLLCAAEDFLRDSPHYYSNMDHLGQGIIYDQFACVDRGIRTYRLPKLAVDLSMPYEAKTLSPNINLPQKINHRLKSWSTGFEGDTLDLLQKSDQELIKKVKAIRDNDNFGSMNFNIEFCKAFFNQWVVQPYKILLKVMLERACR